MSFLSQDFLDYIKMDTDRASFIQNFLKNHGVESSCIVMDGKKHIVVQYPSRFYDGQFKIKTVVAHYDRVEGSEGANDNSAADWMLMNWAVELNNLKECHNVRIFFTDGEELGWNTGVTEQGAYSIASTFKRLGITSDDVYVFDACGRGEVPVLSKTVLPEKVNEAFAKSFNSLYERAQNLLRTSCGGKWMCLPVPYSDNASFLACQIPAVAITMLPASEASLYARELMTSKVLESQVMNRELTHEQRMEFGETEYSYKDRLPLTWKMFHTQDDNAASLTQESFVVMENIIRALTDLKTLR